MSKPTNPDNVYFGPEVDGYIVDFNDSKTDAERNRIWDDHLQAPIAKLVENVFNVNSVANSKLYTEYNFRDWHAIGMSKCFELLSNIDKNKGKAFSYLTLCLRRYYTQFNISTTKKIKRQESVDQVDSYDEANDVKHVTPPELRVLPPDDISPSDYIIQFTAYLVKHKRVFCRQKGPIESYFDGIISALNHPSDVQLVGKGGVKAVNTYVNALGGGRSNQSTKWHLRLRLSAAHRRCWAKYQETGRVD